MKKKRLQQIKTRISEIKRELQGINKMRPGSLTQQYRVPEKKIGGYYQLSYTYKMKSCTEYVRPQFVKDVRQQIITYKRFKKLVEEWITLAIEECKLKMDIDKKIEL
jgi:ribosomal protein L34E